MIGIACGLLAVVICKGLYLVEAGFRRLPVSEFWHPIIGALGFAAVGLVVPRALGVGYDTINDILANRIAVGMLAVLLVGKLLAWWIALGSGTSGGTLAPILLVSGAFGGMIGAAGQRARARPPRVARRGRAGRHGGDVRLGDPSHLHRDRVRVRAHARLPRHPAHHARRRHRRPRVRRAARPWPHDGEARPARAARLARLHARLPAGHAGPRRHDHGT